MEGIVYMALSGFAGLAVGVLVMSLLFAGRTSAIDEEYRSSLEKQLIEATKRK